MTKPFKRPTHCKYFHHEQYGKPLENCKKCGNIIRCGPFEHACPLCEGYKWKTCFKCNKPRFDCGC